MNRIICKIFGHKYKITKIFTFTQRQVKCTRCNKYWAMHDGLRILCEWDGVFEELYSTYTNHLGGGR